MLCPECKELGDPEYLSKWVCKCGEANCVHLETCAACLYIRSRIPGFEEQRLDPTALESGILDNITFHTTALNIGLNLHLISMIGGDRKKAEEQLFTAMRKEMGNYVQSMLKSIYKDVPINEVDRVLANKTVNKYVDQIRKIAISVKAPPPDLGTTYIKGD